MKNTLKILAALLLLPMLSGCDSGDTGATVLPTIGTLTISATGSVEVVNRGVRYHLQITGDSNDVTISQNNLVENMSVTGSNNSITVQDGVTFASFTVSGSNNTIYLPNGSGITYSDTGVGNITLTMTTKLVDGVWSYVANVGTGCVKSYEFYLDGTFKGSTKTANITSEVTHGTYVFGQTVVTGTRHPLDIITTSDNLQADCQGLTTNETGTTLSLHATIVGAAVTGAVMQLYDAPVNGTLVMSLTKL